MAAAFDDLGLDVAMHSGSFYSSGLSLTTGLNSPPITPCGGGRRTIASNSTSPLTEDVAVIGQKLDSLMAAYSEQTSLLNQTRAESELKYAVS